MKQGEAIRAYNAVSVLNKQRLSGPVAKNIFMLYKALQPAWEFQCQEEEKVLSSHPAYDPSINGLALPPDEEGQAKVNAEVQQINQELKVIEDTDFEIEFEKFDFDLNKDRIQITGEDIGNLEPFINFI